MFVCLVLGAQTHCLNSGYYSRRNMKHVLLMHHEREKQATQLKMVRKKEERKRKKEKERARERERERARERENVNSCLFVYEIGRYC